MKMEVKVVSLDVIEVSWTTPVMRREIKDDQVR